ncbi:MAG: PSD1 domain-containing protein [Planctomycetales bacterium]|nr:PSD1 domain-containing protein [Planctomycetales bacterium]
MKQIALPRAGWLVVSAVVVFAAPHFARGADGKIIFNRDIRPILSNNCYKCHGFDDKERKAGLRFDTEEGMRKELESGDRAIVPGKSAESSLIERIMSDDATLRMPPPGTGKVLTPPQKALLKRWIDEGAEFKQHWSFIAPTRPAAPEIGNRQSAIGNSIDRFVLARLEREGMQPSPSADKITLIRRLTLDLTGLPPTPADVDAFVADPAPAAYEKLIDRLLASPRFGEHLGRYWLDAARYGDTHGLHFDNERSLWPYREWVINAFNANKPFDQFTVEQLAGDLLPSPTLEQRIATGFNRCNVSTSEGGSIDEEVRVRYAVDRVETTSTVFLGLTLGCAVCHSHKFDPVSQEEFYGLFSFFNSVADNAMDGNALLPPPVIKLPKEEQTVQLKVIDDQLAALNQQAEAEVKKVEYVEPPVVAGKSATDPFEFVWIDDAAPSGAQLQGDSPWEFVSKPEPVFSGEKATKRTGTGTSQHYFTGANPGLKVGEGDKLFAYVYLDPVNPPKTVMLQWNDGTWEHRAFWGDDTIAFGSGDVPGHRKLGALPEAGKWVRLEVDAAHVGLPAGKVLNGWAFTQFAGTVYWDKAGIVTRTPQDNAGFESQLAWEVYDKAQAQSKVPQPVRDAIKVEADKRNDDQKKLIRNYFVERVYAKARPTFDPIHQKIDALTKQRTDIDGSIPSTMVMADMAAQRETFLLIRGAYDKKGQKVTAGVPAVLPPLPKDAPVNRLGLAKWLVDPSHPLTARVTVNRFWQQLFGRGIVKTSEDFGAQGQWPSHPELLDWLAVEFRESGWNVKHLFKLMAMSATYQQSSRMSPEMAARDPENELLARGPRFRMDAEVVRDTALAASGLLVDRIGGKSGKIYQPDGLWEAVSFVGSNSGTFKQDTGEALYRRSLYTFWKRTSPPPSLLTFDAPSRETCTVRRARTNTPLQALVLLNDKQYVEAARQLAQRMLLEGGSTPADRIAHAFRLATSRRPTSDELAILTNIYQSQLLEFQADKESATKLLSYGDSKRNESLDAPDHAAWTMVANVILNLDETVTKE